MAHGVVGGALAATEGVYVARGIVGGALAATEDVYVAAKAPPTQAINDQELASYFLRNPKRHFAGPAE